MVFAFIDTLMKAGVKEESVRTDRFLGYSRTIGCSYSHEEDAMNQTAGSKVYFTRGNAGKCQCPSAPYRIEANALRGRWVPLPRR